MRLKNTLNNHKKNISTEYILYRPDHLFPPYRIFLENFYFRLFKKNFRFFIITRKSRTFSLGYQQTFHLHKTDSQETEKLIIKNNQFLQNNYIYKNPKFSVYPYVYFIFTTVVILLVGYLLPIQILKCFPNPEVFFNESSQCFSIFNKIYFLPVLTHSKSPPWKAYQQDLLLRQPLVKQLLLGYGLQVVNQGNKICSITINRYAPEIVVPEDLFSCKHPLTPPSVYYLDWLLSHGIAKSQFYHDYLSTQNENAWILDSFPSDVRISRTQVVFHYDAGKLNLSLIILPEQLPPIFTLNLPVNFHLKSVQVNKTPLNPDKYWLSGHELKIDRKALSLPDSSLELNFDTADPLLPNLPQKFLFSLPVGLYLPSFTAIILYNPQYQLVTSSQPTVAQPGFLQYNLASRGNTLLEFSLLPVK